LLQRACSQKKQRLNVRNAPVELALSASARDESLDTLPGCQFSFLFGSFACIHTYFSDRLLEEDKV
jgi:hypothetical protein